MDLTPFDLDDAGPAFRLRGRQAEWKAQIHEDLKTRSRLLVVAPGGVGKTTLFAALASDMWARGIRTLVLENRDRLTEQTADRIRKETGLDVDVEKGGQRASPHAPIVVACVQSLSKTSRLTGFSDTHFGLVVPDECFPSWVAVDGRSISKVRPGDLVNSYNHEKRKLEIRRVLAASRSLPSSLVQVHLRGKGEIICTPGHPFFTKRGYVRAIDLTSCDEVASGSDVLFGMRKRNNAVRCAQEKQAQVCDMQKELSRLKATGARSPMSALQQTAQMLRRETALHEPVQCQERESILQYRMQGRMDEEMALINNEAEGWHCGNESRFFCENEKKKPHVRPEKRYEDGDCDEGQDISIQGRQRPVDGATEGSFVGVAGIRDGISDTNSDGQRPLPFTSIVLQGGLGDSGSKTGNRGGRQQSQNEEVEIFGRQKNRSLEFFRVDGVEVLESRSAFGYSEMRGDGYVYNLEVEGNNNYFADGFLVHNCHLSLSPSWIRIINYFHYGATSLTEHWTKPDDGKYRPLCSVIGFTASPNLGRNRSLGELFQKASPDRDASVNYSFLDAITEGWLVGLKEINVPVRIDTSRFRVKRTEEGAAFNVADQNAAYTPEVIEKLAQHYVQYASDRKGIVFVPSVEIARQMSAAIASMGLRSTFVSGECIDKNAKTDAFSSDGSGSVLVNCALYNYGVDFPDVDCIAPFGAMISKVKYIQSIYRGTRVLPGVLKEGMTQEERLAAIAASAKQYALVLSPFFISTRIDICEPFDLFSETHERSKKVTPLADFTKPGEIRDYIAALEKALNKHANKQPRTGNPVSWALAVGDEALAHYVPETAAEAKPASKGELDFIWEASKGALDTSAIKSSGEAQLTIQRLMERERLGLASVRHVQTLLRFGMNPDQVMTMKAGQAGAIIGRTTAKWDAARAS